MFGAESKEPFDVFQCKIAQRSIAEMIYILNNTKVHNHDCVDTEMTSTDI